MNQRLRTIVAYAGAVVTKLEDCVNLSLSASQMQSGTLSKSKLMALTVVLVCCSTICAPGSFAATVTVSLGDNLQSLVNQYPTGTTFSIAPGVHRLQSVVPKSYDSFVGQSGAVLSGAELLTSFSYSGSYWVSQVRVTRAASYPGKCDASHPACALPEDLFFDNVRKTRVTSLSALGPGKWYLDYSTGNVYMGDNHSGHTVEISLLPHAFNGGAAYVTISNLVIEKYACVAGDGAVTSAHGGAHWAVKSNEVRFNHGTGIRSGNNMWIYNNKVHDNGQLGVGGTGNTIVLQGNEIAYNNYAGYSYYWEAGGAKFASVQHLTVQYNKSHDNVGPGFTTDVNSRYVLYDSNTTTQNREAGILHELGYDATIRNNYIYQDGFNPDGTGSLWWGAGILITDSSNVTIYGNNVSKCMNGIGGILVSRGIGSNGLPYSIENLNVYSNKITQVTGIAEGIVIGSGYDNSVYTSWNNHFQNDTYYLTYPATYAYFFWLGEKWTLATWDTYDSLH